MLFHLKSGSLIQPRLLLAIICAICTIPGQTGADADPASCPAVTRAAGIPLVAFPSWTTRSSLPVSDSNFGLKPQLCLLLPLPQDRASAPLLASGLLCGLTWSLPWSPLIPLKLRHNKLSTDCPPGLSSLLQANSIGTLVSIYASLVSTHPPQVEPQQQTQS